MAYYNNNGSQNYQRGNQNDWSKQLPNGYLQEGYYFVDENNNLELNPNYIVKFSKEIADLLTDNKMNKSSQIRKYYDYCVRIRDVMNIQNRNFEAIEGEFNRLIPLANYAQSRKRVSSLFVDFITKNVEQIKDKDDFLAFLKHFEAIIAYLPKEQQ